MIAHKKLVLLPLLVGLVWAGAQVSTTAQNSGDVVVDPVFQEVIIKPKPDTQYFNFKLTNNTSVAQTFSLKTVDFGSLNESGGVAFIGVDKPELDYEYGLSSWISLGNEAITVGPNKTEQVKIKISDISSMTPGGHYGAILVQPQKSSGSGEPSKIELSQVVSTLVLAKKVGGEVYNLELKSQQVERSALGLPKNVTLRFHNGGNVHLVPRGTVMVTDSKGRVVSEGLINPESGYILPQSNRQYDSTLQSRSNAWWPGNYYLNINYRYDGNDKFETQRVKIFYFGKIVVIIPLLIVATGLGIWQYRKRK